MKKILLLLLLIPTYANAEIFYTDYYETNEYEESELLKTEEKTLYRNYFLIRGNAKYYEKGTQPYYVPYIDEDDYIESYKALRSPTSNEELNTYFKIKNITNVRYLMLRDFDAEETTIKSIKVYNNDEEINYSFYSNDYDFSSKLIRRNNIIIDLEKTYELKNIEIKIEMYNEQSSRIAFMLNIYEIYKTPTKNYSYFTVDISEGRNNENYTIKFYNKNDFENIIEEKIFWIENNKISETTEFTFYKENIYMYKYYNIRRVYTFNYTEEPKDKYLLDYDDYIIETKYYKKDYIELKDEIENEKNPYELIINSSIPKDQIKLSLEENNYIILKIEYNDNIFYKKYIIPKKINNQIESTYKKVKSTKISEENNQDDNNEQTKTNSYTPTKTPKRNITTTATHKISTTKEKTTIKKTTTTTNILKKKYTKPKIILIIILIILFIIYRYIRKKKN